MGSLYRVDTLRLTKQRMERVLARVCVCPGYREAGANTRNHLTLERSVLPDLAGYEIVPGILGLCIRGQHGPSLSGFWGTAAELGDTVTAVYLTLAAAESGKSFDPKEETDILLTIGRGRLGVHASLELGAVSPGIKDIGYRTGVLTRFVVALGLQKCVRIRLCDGEMSLRVTGPGWRDTAGLSRDAIRQLAANAEGGVSRIGGTLGKTTNFYGLTVYLPTLSCLIERAPRVVDAMGGTERVVKSTLHVNCGPPNHEAVRALLNPKPFGPWLVDFMAVSRYRISDLDQIVAEAKEVLFRAFTVKPRGVGPVEAELYYADGTFMLTFTASCETERQTQALERFVADLGEGEDIVDHTPT